MMEKSIEFKVERIHRLSNSSTMKAFVDLIINDAILIKGLRVVQGKKGLFVSMPQNKGKDNKWYDTVLCLSKEARWSVAKEVLAAYNQEEKV